MTVPQLTGMTWQEITELLKEHGESSFRGRQVHDWVLRGAEAEEMTNLPVVLRERLKEITVVQPVRIEHVYLSKTDGTAKFLYLLEDGNMVEGVLMRYHYGDTLCLSTQVGCRMGCRFCASTLDGCIRSLTPGEMMGQVIRAEQWARSTDPDRRVHNIVLMGSGEPLDNYDNVMRFLRLVNDPGGKGISLRNISLSTCGLCDRMHRFAEEGLPVTLSVSLHAPNDAIRRTMMPVAERWPIEQVLQECRYYIEKTGRRVVFEYALVEGVNCSAEHADELARRLRGMQCHVNLIPLNAVKERSLRAPDRTLAEQFLRQLEKRHISATIRREMGSDIDGACGQLRRKVLGGEETATRAERDPV